MKKKILFVTNHFRFSNGVASVLRSLIANLDTKKYEIYLLAIYEFNKEFAAPIMDKIKVVPGFGFYFRGFDKLVNLMPTKILYKMFIKENFDLEIAFQFGIPTRMLAVSQNKHRLCWMHGYDKHMVLRKYYERYPKVINVAREGMNKMVAAGFSEAMCDYCYNIIDEEEIIERSTEQCPITKKNQYIIITVGRLTPEKAFMRYLKCIEELVKTHKNVEFWIVGGGSEEEKMNQYVRERNLDEYVKMLGKQNNPYKFIKDADLYFCCSYREGFSTSCQEAAILGVPVVSVQVGGAEELRELTGCGIVLDNNEEAIINGLSDILSNENQIKKWKEQAQKNKVKLYKQERLSKAIEILEDGMK